MFGPSNDDDQNTQIEILAAELGQNVEVWTQWHNCERHIDDDLARIGVRGFLSLGATSPNAEHAFLSPPGFQDELDRRDYWAGWLARDIAGLDESDDVWSWDPSRPVAGQHEAHMASGDAMLDEVIAGSERLGAALTAAASDAPVENDEPALTDAEAATIIEQSSGSYAPYASEAFSPVDTASREPWHTTEEMELSEACEACSAAVDACDRAETKLREVVAELVTVVPEGAA